MSDGIVPDWGGVLENLADYCRVKMEQLVWWDACSLQLFQEVQSFAGFGYNGTDVGRPR